MSEKKPVCLILSGGMDSSVLAHWLRKHEYETHCLSFLYGQRHQVELSYASRTAGSLGFRHTVVDLHQLKTLLNSSVLTDYTRPVPQGHYAQENMSQTVVPNRNMIMLSIAAGFAASRGMDQVFTAVHAGDHAIYPDCRPQFIKSLNDTLFAALEGIGNVLVNPPFAYITKKEIAFLGKELGIDWATTYSCYEGQAGVHCGRCGTCVERLEALDLAGVADDRTVYEDKHFWRQAVMK